MMKFIKNKREDSQTFLTHTAITFYSHLWLTGMKSIVWSRYCVIHTYTYIYVLYMFVIYVCNALFENIRNNFVLKIWFHLNFYWFFGILTVMTGWYFSHSQSAGSLWSLSSSSSLSWMYSSLFLQWINALEQIKINSANNYILSIINTYAKASNKLLWSRGAPVSWFFTVDSFDDEFSCTQCVAPVARFWL